MSEPRRGVSVVVPALDEASSIAAVVRGCREVSGEVIVVDGASSDETARLARRAGARVVDQVGRGKGRAMLQGAREASGDTVVFIDGDGSHLPQDIPDLVRPIVDGEAELVVASRILGGSEEAVGGVSELVRLVGAACITTCLNLRFKVDLTDSQNGFRAIRRDVLLALGLRSRHTTIEQEMIAKVLKRGYRIIEVGSRELRRAGGGSKVRPGRMWPAYLGWLLRSLL